ncbi:peroxisomal targeting signal 1 receptor-like [Stegodyphus dumicola]|uniref:peroxisomal targeting signal 1 receptor-like n=1 Tax=Stegodyphus dumicola TaxID=202533 RepID=UPI0015B0FA6C|nr:peroxisomal targeting signal 1 receptor-like [Stegodyphus dumicola]
MAMRDLIDGDCGVTNPLLKIAGHFTQNKGPQAGQPSSASASDQLVKEFLFDANEAERHAPETFNMHALFNQMTEISASYHQRPNEGEKVEDFSFENVWRQSYSDSHDLICENIRFESFDNNKLATYEQVIQNQCPLGNDWAQNFKAQSCSEINEITTGLCDYVADPKISVSKSAEDLEVVWEGSQHANKDFKTVSRTEDEKNEAQNDEILFNDLQREWEIFVKMAANFLSLLLTKWAYFSFQVSRKPA